MISKGNVRKEGAKMITILNRKEVAVTCSMEEQARVRDALAAAGIPYTFTTADTQARDTRTGVRPADWIGGRTKSTIEYRIFVKKTDYESAMQAISKR